MCIISPFIQFAHYMEIDSRKDIRYSLNITFKAISCEIFMSRMEIWWWENVSKTSCPTPIKISCENFINSFWPDPKTFWVIFFFGCSEVQGVKLQVFFVSGFKYIICLFDFFSHHFVEIFLGKGFVCKSVSLCEGWIKIEWWKSW